MTSSHPTDGAALAVTPVVDCEPPPLDVRQCRSTAPGTLRRRPTEAAHHVSAPPALSLPMRQAAGFADAALRRVLEVIDRRRPVAQLTGMLAAGLVDSVLSANRSTPAPSAVAVLRRVRVQPVHGPTGVTAAEVFGSYRRGRRTHAIAGRIEPTAPGGGWQVVALHIG